MSTPLTDAFATILFQMQQAVQMTSATAPNDVQALGPMAPAWRAARKELGLAGKWATLEETRAALSAKLGGAGVATGLSGGFSPEELAIDPALGGCPACGSLGSSRDENGACSVCGC